MNATDTQNYLQLLEKTNQQLSLWYSPFTLSIGFLTLFIAILALFFTYVLWRQGKDYREFLEEQKNIISAETKTYAKKVLDEQIQKQQERQEKLTGEARQKIQSEIQALMQARNSLNRAPDFVSWRGGIPLAYEVKSSRRTSKLTEPQIQSILALLSSFGAEVKTIQDVETALRG